MENRNGVVMGYPAGYYQAQQPYQYPGYTIETPTPIENKPPLRVRCAKYILLIMAPIFVILFLSFGIYLFFTLQLLSPKIQVNNISIYTFNVSNGKMTTNWNFTLVSQNHNKYSSIHFKNIRLGIFGCDEKRVASTNIDDFSLGIGRESTLKANITAMSAYLKNKSTMFMAFVLKMDAVVWLESSVWDAEQWQLMEANCGTVIVDAMRREMILGSKWCKVDVK